MVSIVLALALFMSGCTTMQKQIDSNTETTELLSSRQDESSETLEALETRIFAIENSIASVEAHSTGSVQQMQDSLDATKKDIASIKRRLSIGSAARKALMKVKVLAGDDDLKKAKTAAKKLERNGFSVRIVDFTPEPRFKHPVVYYAKGFRYEAKEIARLMGKRAEVRKLTWNSVYDIILVTAGK
jgi:septal ring factor EnvC (AmiA/AmiB activator)